MNFNKLRNIENRPLDYLTQRNCRSTIQHRSNFGPNMIGWEAVRLKDNVPCKGNHSQTIRFLDSMRKNHFPSHSGKFAKVLDKQLKMIRGFPFSKLDV